MISQVLAARRSIGGPLAVGGGGAADWFRAGGAPVPWAAYKPKGAASLAASYLDLSGNGRDATPVVAPTWNATDGQIYNGVDQYLTTTFVPAADRTQVMIIQYTTLTGSGVRVLAGSTGTAAATSFYLRAGVNYANGGVLSVAPGLTAGNLAVAGNQGYRNGVADGSTIAGWGAGVGAAVYIGCQNNNGTPASFAPVYIQALAIYDDSTNHAVWVPQVQAAMAAL